MEDLFQKLPVARLIVGHYALMTLSTVVMSDGTIYTNHSNVNGGWHYGDMREDIAKSLVSMGINNANYGIHSSTPHHHSPHHVSLATVHRAAGIYLNGHRTHGFSGGNGMITAYSLNGPEFTHELGHIFNMGHNPGGPDHYVHSQRSGWGWDARHDRFIANFIWAGRPDADAPAFADVYQWNIDAMTVPNVAGVPSWTPGSRFIHYSGYTQKRIQSFLEGQKVFADSSSGYALWDEESRTMVDADGEPDQSRTHHGVDVVTLLGFYDPEGDLSSHLYPAFRGSYGHVYASDDDVKPTRECFARVTYGDGQTDAFRLASGRFVDGRMNKVHINVPADSEPVSASVGCPTTRAMKINVADYAFAHVHLPSSDVSEGAIVQIDRTSAWTPYLYVGSQ